MMTALYIVIALAVILLQQPRGRASSIWSR
jgi:hypothetical protein